MAIDAEGYQEQLQALSPQGLAWNRDKDSQFAKMLGGLADSLARVDARIEDALNEIDPRTTAEMLPEWERLLGLPDKCTVGTQTLQDRRQAVHSKLTSKGGQSRFFFTKLALSLGYTITITEFRPFICGMSRCADALQPPESRFVWRVNLSTDRPVYFRTGESLTGEKLVTLVSATQLECLFQRLKPAQTTLVFNYT